MEWVESKGGPLVLLDESQLERWSGVRGGDYERACDVANEVEAVSLAGHDVLVLGDEPLRTAWVADKDGGVFVRWVYAETEQSALTALGSKEEVLFEDTGIRIATKGQCRLIDAADPGDVLTSGNLSVQMRPGTYRVDTGVLDAGPEVRLLLHKLAKVE